MSALTLAEAAPLIRAFYRENRYRMTCIYAIQQGYTGPIKVGVAKVPAERLKTLQTANAEKLRGLAAWRDAPETENWIHEEFAHAHLRGEWFRPDPELVEYVLFRGGMFEDWDWAQLKRDWKALEEGRELEELE